MFRRPMRLEKWIAFDGALGVEVLSPEPDADVHEADNSGDAEDYGFSFAEDSVDDSSDAFAGIDDDDLGFAISPLSLDIGWSVESKGKNCSVKVELPDDADAALLPFLDETVKFSTGNGGDRYAQGNDFFLEITAPTDGSFGFVNWSDVKNNQSGFISANGLSTGDKVAFAFVENGKNYVTVRTVTKFGYVNYFSEIGSDGNGGGRAEFAQLADGGIRIHLTEKGNYTYGNGSLKQILQSLAFYADDDATPTKVEGFHINAYYLEGAGKSSEDLFHDGEGGMFNPDNEDVSVSSTDPDFVHVNADGSGDGGDDGGEGDGDGDDGGDDGDGGDEEIIDPPPGPEEPTPEEPGPSEEIDPGDPEPPPPGPEIPEPEKPLEPVIPPSEPGSGDADSGGDGETDASDASDQSDAGGDAGPEGGDAGGDDLVYIYRRDGEDEAAEDDGEDVEDKKDVATVEAELVEGGMRLVETAAEAAMMELGRSAEVLLSAVRGEREILMGSVTRLQNEYLLRGAAEYAGLRTLLREIFDMGNREKDAINRILTQMNRQMAVFREFTPELRDGMLTESLRELMDSAERRTGETGAFSQAIDAVTRLLVEARQNGRPVPSADDVSGLFDEAHAEAMQRWLAKAELSDPMGKELAAAERARAEKTAVAE